MELSVIAYLILLLAVAILRVFELRVSRRNQQRLVARGAVKLDKPKFRWVVLVHTAVLIGAAFGARPRFGWHLRAAVGANLRRHSERIWLSHSGVFLVGF